MAQGKPQLLTVRSEEDLLPPTAKRKIFERIGLRIREHAGVSLEERLDPWVLAPDLNLRVVSLDDISGISESVRNELLGGDGWSGGASMPLPDGTRLVFLNPTHSPERQAASLMEEISHVVLGHSPTRIHGLNVGKGKRERFRDFNAAQEEAAYAVGAAALVPYFPLKRATTYGLEPGAVAKHYGVSNDLVIYRIKVCRLWTEFRNAEPAPRSSSTKRRGHDAR